jgi:hypothetical protein
VKLYLGCGSEKSIQYSIIKAYDTYPALGGCAVEAYLPYEGMVVAKEWMGKAFQVSTGGALKLSGWADGGCRG